MKEPKRYMANARETLKKSSIEDNVYTDVKYVKSAFGIAYLGVLEAINNCLRGRGLTERDLPGRIEEYQKALKKYGGMHNGRLIRQFNVIYHELHTAGYYHGELRSANIVKDAFKNAEDFINKMK